MKKHLYEVDLLRAFVILGVVCVHVLSFYNLFPKPFSNQNIGFETAITTFHFTREAFMFMTGLVLFVTYYNKPFKVLPFWGKRFKLIVIPYLSFILIYILFSGTYLKKFQWTFGYIGHTYLQSILTGNQFFMYYLVISMQLYLVFPLMVWWLKRSEKWHLHIIIGSFILELGLMAMNQFWLQNLPLHSLPGWLATLVKYRDRNIITYQFWFIAGGIMSVHYAKVRPWLEKNGKWLLTALILGLLALWGHFYYDRVILHKDETMSVLVLQPIMIPYSFIVTANLLYAGIHWSNARENPRVKWFSSFVMTAAKASFGVFLVHPLVLHYVMVAVYTWHPSANLRVWIAPLSILCVYGVGIVVATAIAKVPYLSYIVGQKTSMSRPKVSSLSQAS